MNLKTKTLEQLEKECDFARNNFIDAVSKNNDYSLMRKFETAYYLASVNYNRRLQEKMMERMRLAGL